MTRGNQDEMQQSKLLEFLFCNGARIIASVYTPSEAEEERIDSWSLAPLRKRGNGDTTFLKVSLYKVCEEMGIRRLRAPHVSAASADIDLSSFEGDIHLGGDTFLHCRSNPPADGILLDGKQGFVMSGLGCPLIAGTASHRNPNKPPIIIVAHGGRDCLVDRGAVVGKPTRQHVSVVQTIAHALIGMGGTSRSVEMGMLFSIPQRAFEHRFDHGRYGAHNRALFHYLNRRWPDCTVTVRNKNSFYLSLETLFELQAEDLGIRAWTSHPANSIEGMAYPNGSSAPRSDRNLIVIKRS